VLLLERLASGRTLSALELREAASEAGKLLRRLAIPAPPGFRNVRTLVDRTAHNLEEWMDRPDCPLPRIWLEKAVQLARRLETEARIDLLIHADLHYDNILAGKREPWLAIDPRPVAGEPEQAVPELMWTRLEDAESDQGIERLLATLVANAELDAARAREWVIVRCVDYWLWGLEHDLTEDPKRCRRILEALM